VVRPPAPGSSSGEAPWAVTRDRICACGCGALADHDRLGPCRNHHPVPCLAYRMPPEEAARLMDQEIGECLDFNGQAPRLPAELARDILDTLTSYEETYQTQFGQWDQHPRVLTVYLGEHPTTSHALMVEMTEIPIPPGIWEFAGDRTNIVLTVLAQKMQRDPFRVGQLLGLHQSLVGFATMGEAFVHTHPVEFPCPDGEKLDEVRYVTAVDLDGREYYVSRLRSDGTCHGHVRASKPLRGIVAGEASPEVDRDAHIPEVAGALAQLVGSVVAVVST